jgi:hypothetical protein
MVSQKRIDDGTDPVLTTENFVRIREFILVRGQRTTYCNRYSNNPYYEFGDLTFYLNPDRTNIHCDLGKWEFTTLVVRDPNGTADEQYWDIELDRPNRRLRLAQYYMEKQGVVLARECAGFFRKALEEIGKFPAK